MTDSERKMIIKLMRKSISQEEFLKKFTVNILNNPNYIKELLELAYTEKNPDDVDYSLHLIFEFNLFDEANVIIDLLCKLLYASWHYQHENIASIFQKLKNPQTIDCLFETALMQFKYLDFDEAYALAVKCIWALGDINTNESRIKLKQISKSDNEIIRENAIKQLKRNSL